MLPILVWLKVETNMTLFEQQAVISVCLAAEKHLEYSHGEDSKMMMVQLEPHKSSPLKRTIV